MKKLILFLLILLFIVAVAAGAAYYLFYDATDALTEGEKAELSGIEDEMKSVASSCEKHITLGGESYALITTDDITKVACAGLKGCTYAGAKVESAWAVWRGSFYTLYISLNWHGFKTLLSVDALPVCSGALITLNITGGKVGKLSIPNSSIPRVLAELPSSAGNGSMTVDADGCKITLDISVYADTMADIITESLGINTSNPFVQLIVGALDFKNTLSCAIDENGSLKVSFNT